MLFRNSPISDKMLKTGVRTSLFYAKNHLNRFQRRQRNQSIRLAELALGRDVSSRKRDKLLSGRTLEELIHGKRRNETEDQHCELYSSEKSGSFG